MSDLTKLVKVPKGINSKYRPCNTVALIRRYGMPAHPLPANCSDNKNLSAFWKSRMVTENVGPFRVTGHRMAVAQLRAALEEVHNVFPLLYSKLSSAGMLCVRHVRGNPGVPSNHSLGLAIDFRIDGLLDPYGDGLCQKGLIDLYSVLKKYGFYWGAEFRKEDAMHFEISDELVRKWIAMGVF